MNEERPERDDLFWHALNYRGASVDSAEQMWQELVACHERLIAAAVAAERERCAAWLRWFDGKETRRSEAIRNGDHWASDLVLGPNN